MITWIEIERFRGILKGRLDGLTPLTILVGPNGCGKSTVLDALSLGADQGYTDALKRCLGRYAFLSTAPRWVQWQGDRRGTCRISAANEHGNGRTIEIAAGATVKVTRLNQAEPVLYQGGTGPNLFGSPFTPDPAWILECHLIDAGADLQNVPLVELFSLASQKGTRKLATELLREIIPKLENIELQTEAGVPTIHLDFGDRTVPAALGGEGTYSLLRMCLELSTRKGGLILMEEPEVHLHPAAIWRAAKAIAATVIRGVQVVLSTHSLELIDAILDGVDDSTLEQLSLFSLRLDDGTLISSRLPGKDVAFSRRQIEDDLR